MQRSGDRFARSRAKRVPAAIAHASVRAASAVSSSSPAATGSSIVARRRTPPPSLPSRSGEAESDAPSAPPYTEASGPSPGADLSLRNR